MEIGRLTHAECLLDCAALSVSYDNHLKKEKNLILAQVNSYHAHRPGHLWAGVAVICISLFGMVAAFGTVADNRAADIPRRIVIEGLALQVLSSNEDRNQLFQREERVRSGDTVGLLMQRLGVNDSALLDFLRSNASTQVLYSQLSPGKNLTAVTDIEGRLQSMSFPLNGGNDDMLVIEKEGNGFLSKKQALRLDSQIVLKSAEIHHSLYGAADAVGIPDAIATQLASIFAGDIDFHKDLRKGDRFSLVYESFSHRGHIVRTGRILAAEFINDGKTYRAVWFKDKTTPNENGGYYTAQGKNIRKAFLRSPLEFSRITSGFSTARFHPLLQMWRAHKGIDYGAPVGARIKATGDGVVEFIGTKGGYGKAIVLRHQGRYTTLYGHLSAFARGLRQGSRVTQGDVIGLVGATGLASGPHLHYEFRINEVHQNPLAMVLPAAPSLTALQLVQFRQRAAPYLAQIELIQGLNIAQLD